jgi:hypothetical protein
MRTNSPICWTAIFAAGLLLTISATSESSTVRLRPLNLSQQDQQILADGACNTHPQEIRAGQMLGVEKPVDSGVVYCGPHAEDAGHPIGLRVDCSRPQGQEYWDCRKATPMLEMKIDQRTVRVLYQFASAKEVLEVLDFMLSRPSLRNVVVNPDWLASDVRVHRDTVRFSVSASDYIVHFIPEGGRQGKPHFRIERISHCPGDQCSVIAEE